MCFTKVGIYIMGIFNYVKFYKVLFEKIYLFLSWLDYKGLTDFVGLKTRYLWYVLKVSVVTKISIFELKDMFPQLKGYQDKASWCEEYL